MNVEAFVKNCCHDLWLGHDPSAIDDYCAKGVEVTMSMAADGAKLMELHFDYHGIGELVSWQAKHYDNPQRRL
ncbi:MAG: hypothetical protein COV52_04785 [Gammaproteobacteria bacterium CG11_big_fil_rev_8_21_14_0_20_46_22]|nr:MAG: hypothetical protein COW05_02870 [Gammaproteobacteria bacterium CG12_big_fil_rev_8_21_14_0_65_46_12]PIR11257.1 MAG: hypothetical protein COV52_04785 [Gammaproteobacteria bacterium CG11_big_fil_rev_8_21_14_0_20_46_22]